MHFVIIEINYQCMINTLQYITFFSTLPVGFKKIMLKGCVVLYRAVYRRLCMKPSTRRFISFLVPKCWPKALSVLIEKHILSKNISYLSEEHDGLPVRLIWKVWLTKTFHSNRALNSTQKGKLDLSILWRTSPITMWWRAFWHLESTSMSPIVVFDYWSRSVPPASIVIKKYTIQKTI